MQLEGILIICNFRVVRIRYLYLLINMLSVCFITTQRIRYKPWLNTPIRELNYRLTNLLVEKGLGAVSILKY